MLYLRNNIHPRTRKPLPPPVDEGGHDLGGTHAYRQLEVKCQRKAGRAAVDLVAGSGTTTEQAASTGVAMVQGQYLGRSAADKQRERLERVRVKEAANKRKDIPRRLTGKQPPRMHVQEPNEGCRTWHGMW